MLSLWLAFRHNGSPDRPTQFSEIHYSFIRRSVVNLCVIGCGYVGLVTGACLAEAGHEAVCTDINAERIAILNAGEVPIYEQYLGEILASARKSGKISYTANIGDAIRAGDAIFICVGTPP